MKVRTVYGPHFRKKNCLVHKHPTTHHVTLQKKIDGPHFATQIVLKRIPSSAIDHQAALLDSVYFSDTYTCCSVEKREQYNVRTGDMATERGPQNSGAMHLHQYTRTQANI